MLILYASASVYLLCCFEVIVNCCNGSYNFFFLIQLLFGVCVFLCVFSISISSVEWVHSLIL